MLSYEEAITLVKKSSVIGLALPAKASSDETGAAFALKKVLSAMGKEVGIIFYGHVPEILKTLVPAEEILKSEGTRFCDFVISINKNSPVGELRYEKESSSLNIILSPKDRPICKEDITVQKGQAKYDIIMTIGVNTFEDLGQAFEDSPNLFYDKLVIALGAKSAKENFGDIILVDPARSSVSEIAAEFILELAPDTLETDSSTALLLGIVEKTRNFQNGKTRPSTFAVAAELVSRGGKKDEIVRVLWKTKPLQLLQLWGRASIRSRLDPIRKILWSALTKDDFEKTGTYPKDITFVLQHIEEHFALPENFVLLWQHPEENSVRILYKNSCAPADEKNFDPSVFKEDYYSLKQPFSSFREAEEAVSKLIGVSPV